MKRTRQFSVALPAEHSQRFWVSNAVVNQPSDTDSLLAGPQSGIAAKTKTPTPRRCCCGERLQAKCSNDMTLRRFSGCNSRRDAGADIIEMLLRRGHSCVSLSIQMTVNQQLTHTD